MSSVPRVGPKMAAAAPARDSNAFHFIPPGGLATDEEFAEIWKVLEAWPLAPQQGSNRSKLAGVMLLQPPRQSYPIPALEAMTMQLHLPQPATVGTPTPSILILYTVGKADGPLL